MSCKGNENKTSSDPLLGEKNLNENLILKVTKDVERRIEDLTHQIHREILNRCVEQLKTLAPILICSMKIFIQILSQGKDQNFFIY